MKKISKVFAALALLIILGTIFQNVAMFRTGRYYDFGVGYWGPLARDGVWHEAVTGQILRSAIPQNPGFSGVKLQNYHFFYDAFVALLTTAAPARQIIYQILPIVFSIFLGALTFVLARKMFKSEKAALFSVFFVYFGSSFGWVVDLYKGREIGGESSFWANQPVSMNLNPPFAISLVILIALILGLFYYLEKPKKYLGILLAISGGLLLGFKVYAAVIYLSALFVLMTRRLYFKKDLALLPLFVGSLFTALGVFLLVTSGASLIKIEPFWLINTMIDAGDRVGLPNLTARRFAYQGGGRWIRFGLVEIFSFLIFVVGNLGTRVVAFGLIKKIRVDDLNFLVCTMAVFSFIPTLIFVQKGNPWNIIQFAYYTIFFVSLYAGYSLAKLSEARKKYITYPLLFIIFALTPISSIATFRSWLYPRPVAYLPRTELEALNFLKSQELGVVLKHPYDGGQKDLYSDPFPLAVFADNAYVSAYSQMPVYLEDVEQQIILDTGYKNRVDDLNKFFEHGDLTWSKAFLFENNIKYIYLPKIYSLPAAEQEYPMRKIYENSDVNIYQTDSSKL